jgi:hypothetical protein
VEDANRLAPPAGWYPDPGGGAQWRRWLGTSWADATMPFSPPVPDDLTLARERAAWWGLRVVAPWALAAPAFAAVSLASESRSFAAVRRWLHAYVSAELHHRALPSLPTSSIPAGTTADSFITFAVLVLTFLGFVAWLRFSSSSIRVAKAAKYPQRHSPVAASASMVVPVIGPFVASSASRANLPDGHEARPVLALGWGLVVAGEVSFFALYVTVLWTSSLPLAWAIAALCGVAWIAAAFELPLGLAAIAEDHEGLDVRRRRALS